jgi:hypothetical protein
MGLVVYSFDEEGFLTGMHAACESPLEPGVFLLPAHATFLSPPQCPEGSFPRFNGASWEIFTPEPPTQDTAPPSPPAPTSTELLAAIRNERTARIFATKWIQERHLDELALGVPTTLSAESYRRWLEYWQALRKFPDLPGLDPANPTWPAPPSGG